MRAKENCSRSTWRLSNTESRTRVLPRHDHFERISSAIAITTMTTHSHRRLCDRIIASTSSSIWLRMTILRRKQQSWRWKAPTKLPKQAAMEAKVTFLFKSDIRGAEYGYHAWAVAAKKRIELERCACCCVAADAMRGGSDELLLCHR